jgi:hypothetical protein
MGPIFVHTHRDENAYVKFFSAFNRMNPNLRDNLQAVGSDGDMALMNAISISYGSHSFLHLLCSAYKKDNIERKLKDLGASMNAKKHVMSDIFGTNVQYALYQKCLIDSETAADFDRNIRDLKPTWDTLVPRFHAWFVSNEAETFKSHLIKEITDRAHLVCRFNNNRVESISNNIKDWVGRSGNLSIPAFNAKVEDYINCQQREFEMAIYANGPYNLAPTHSYLHKERHIWNALTADQRKQAIQNFWKTDAIGRKV